MRASITRFILPTPLGRSRRYSMVRVFVALAILLAAPSARAQPLQDALDHYRDGRLEQALAELTRVRESAVEDPAVLASAHVYLGVIHATMGDASLARRDFEVALALDPELTAPSELSPDLRRLFDEVQVSAQRLSITLEVPESATVGEPVEFAAGVAHAPPHLVAALRVRAVPADGAPWVSRHEGASATFTIPGSAWSGGSTLELIVEALTAHGGVVARERRPLSAALPQVTGDNSTDGATSGATFDEGGSVAEEAWFWILIATLVLGGVAAAILIPTVGTQDEYQLGVPTIIRM